MRTGGNEGKGSSDGWSEEEMCDLGNRERAGVTVVCREHLE